MVQAFLSTLQYIKKYFLSTFGSLCKNFQCTSASSNFALKRTRIPFVYMPTGLPEAGGKFLKLKLNLGCVFDSSRHVGHIGWDPKGGFDVSSIVVSPNGLRNSQNGLRDFPASIYLLKVNNKCTKTKMPLLLTLNILHTLF